MLIFLSTLSFDDILNARLQILILILLQVINNEISYMLKTGAAGQSNRLVIGAYVQVLNS